jgi:hypothetical protein
MSATLKLAMRAESLTTQQRSCLSATIAGFRRVFQRDPEQFEVIYNEDGSLYAVACVGMVERECHVGAEAVA